MIPQSASNITDFKRCPMLFFLRNVLKLRPIEDSEAARQGTNWHKCLEILTHPQGGKDAMVKHLNEAYATCPPSIDLVKWETERTILLYSALGWEWHWQNDEIKTLAREVRFKREINSVYSRRGMIDRLIERDTRRLVGEYKSTSKPIDSGSLYWDHLKLDSQVSIYLIEARQAQLTGKFVEYGILSTDPLISGVLYDVWHRPIIKPKKLSMADTKKFLVDGQYFGEGFKFQTVEEGGTTSSASVNGVEAEITLGAESKATKKNPEPTRPFAIRETPEMFGARLLADIQENPEKHFARREIARTDKELRQLDEEFSNIARLIDITTKRELWFKNEHQCDATFRCPFHLICYYDQDVTNGRIPDGFKRYDKKEKKNAQ